MPFIPAETSTPIVLHPGAGVGAARFRRALFGERAGRAALVSGAFDDRDKLSGAQSNAARPPSPTSAVRRTRISKFQFFVTFLLYCD